MSYALFASPIDHKADILENKVRDEKNKLNRDALMKQLKPEPQHTETSIAFSPSNVSEIHKNLKEENDLDLSNFYNSELSKYSDPPQPKASQFMLTDNRHNYHILEPPKQQANTEMLNKMNRMIDMFEEQREIKTSKKNEEIVLYCFLGVFTIYMLDSFVSIGKYSR